MQRFSDYFEAGTYEQRPVPQKEAIFSKSESTYSTYKYLEKSVEYTLPTEITDLIKESFCYGIIPEIKTVWISHTRLHLYNYFNCVLKEIQFTSKVENILFFQPIKCFFNEKIKQALLVVTEKSILFYGIDTESNELIETNVVVYSNTRIQDVKSFDGRIFLGGDDGNLYQLIYSNNNFLGLRTAYLKNLDFKFVKKILPFFSKKNQPIKKIAFSKNWSLTLSDNEVKLYNVKEKETKFINSFDLERNSSFIDIKIIEESESNVFFYLINKVGKRFYYTNTSFLFEKRAPLEENDLLPLFHKANNNGLVLYKKTGLAYFINLNEDVLKNFTLNKVIENYEVIKTEFDEIFLKERVLIIVKGRNITFYEINDSEGLLESCRPEEVYTLIKNYGDREIISIFYSLLSKEKDISKIEPMLTKNEVLRKQGYFTFLFRMINEIWEEKIDSVFFLKAERICKKLKIVLGSNFALQEDFSNEFIQSINFLKIAYEYNLSFDFTLSSLMLDELDLRNTLIKKLLTQFAGQVESLENLLSTKCPKFVNFQEIYYFKGLEALDRSKSKENLYESLNNFKFLSFCLEDIIEKYLQVHFYVGSVTILKKLKAKKEENIFIKKINYLKQSLKCKKSIEVGLEDLNKEFSFLIFEALISNLLEKNELTNSNCMCCNSDFKFTFNDLINLNTPFLQEFLAQKSEISLVEEEYNLIWKFLVIKNKTDLAVENLVRIAETKPISLEGRMNYLNIAHTLKNSKELFLKIETLKIQQEFLKIKPNCLLQNKLLSPTELFNDFLLPAKQNLLALRMYDLFNYSDINLLNKLWVSVLQSDLKNDLNLVKQLGLRNSALSLDVIARIFLQKYNLEDMNLVMSLVEIGFNRSEVIDFFERLLKGSEYQHPNEKKKIMDVLVKAGDVSYQKRVKGFCYENYGL